MNKEYIIRHERPSEYYQVENLVRESFWNVYRPGCLEHYVLHCLRADPAFIPELDFVMESKGKLIGQCIYIHADIHADSGEIVPILTMGPIGIRYHGLPEGADASFFLCKELISGYLNGVNGEYATPQGYFVDESECDAFDKLFPPKQKLKLPGQLW